MKIPICEASWCCEMLEFITVILISEISIGLAFIKADVKLKAHEWDGFWKYFEKTWIARFPPTLWNVEGLDDHDVYGRTNNIAERYNRRINERCTTAHASLAAFVGLLQEEESFFSTLPTGIRSGSLPMDQSWKEFNKPFIPEAFLEFKMKMAKTE